MENVKKGATIQSLEIGMGIIDLIAKHGKPIKFSEIQELSKTTKSNLYKYLNTFTQLGILYRDKGSGAYLLGSKLVEYGMAAVDQENVLDRITPYLELLNSKTSSTVLFSIWTNNGPMVIKMFNVSQGFNIGATIGTLLPLFSAAGKIFTAFSNEDIIQSWKESESKRIPQEQLQQLEKEILNIKEKEIAFAREPLVPSVSSVSFPVLNYKRDLLGAVAIVGFSEKIPKSETDPHSEFILEVSRQISESFGYKSVY